MKGVLPQKIEYRGKVKEMRTRLYCPRNEQFQISGPKFILPIRFAEIVEFGNDTTDEH